MVVKILRHVTPSYCRDIAAADAKVHNPAAILRTRPNLSVVVVFLERMALQNRNSHFRAGVRGLGRASLQGKERGKG